MSDQSKFKPVHWFLRSIALDWLIIEPAYHPATTARLDRGKSLIVIPLSDILHFKLLGLANHLDYMNKRKGGPSISDMVNDVSRGVLAIRANPNLSGDKGYASYYCQEPDCTQEAQIVNRPTSTPSGIDIKAHLDCGEHIYPLVPIN